MKMFITSLCVLLLAGLPLKAQEKLVSSITSTANKQLPELKETHNPEKVSRQLLNKLKITDADIYKRAGIDHRVKGKYKLALANQLKALDLFKKEANHKSLAQVYDEIGQIYWLQKDTSQAMMYYEEAQKISEQYDLKEELAITYKHMGCSYLHSKSYEKALSRYQQSLQLIEANHFDHLLPKIYNSIGLTHKRLKNYTDALSYYFKALELSKKYQNQELEAMVLVNIGGLYIKKGQYQKAQNFLDQCLKVATQVQSLSIITFCHKRLFELYEAQGNFKFAFNELQLYTTLKDSAINAKNSREMAELISDYDRDKKKQAIALLKKEKSANRALQYSFIGLLIISIATLGTLMRWQRLKETSAATSLANEQLTKDNLYWKLTLKNQELSAHALQVAQKRQLLEEMKNQLEDISQKPNAKQIRKLITQVNQSLLVNEEWNQINNTLEQSNASFFIKLQEKCKTLTPYELKVCLLAKLNFTIKDAAHFLKKEPNSIGVTRHRIRKKLQLSADDNFNQFMMNVDMAKA